MLKEKNHYAENHVLLLTKYYLIELAAFNLFIEHFHKNLLKII